MPTRVVAVVAVVLLVLLGGCSGGDDPAPPSATETTVEQTPAASAAASSLSPTPTPSPSASAASPTVDGEQVTTADGALRWTMPCTPEQEDISGNEEDAKTYRGYQGWRCGKRGAATSAAFVVELIKKPVDAEAARRAMRTALNQVAPKAKVADNELAGQPGISGTADLGGKEFGLQVISVENYLAVFIATPAKDLSAITRSVQIG